MTSSAQSIGPIKYAEQICYSSNETLMFSYDMAVKYKDSPGVYVETGVAAGAQIIAMAHGAPNKTIYAFDSFQGLPLPSNRDDQMPGIMMLTETERKLLPDPGKQKLETTGATSVSEQDFIDHIDNALVITDISMGFEGSIMVVESGSVIHAVVGWFEETIHFFLEKEENRYKCLLGSKYEIPPFEISILRLDGDLYNSTWVCLQHLFPKVIKGGCVIIDDWQLAGCRAACEEYFESIGYKPDYKFISNIAYFYK